MWWKYYTIFFNQEMKLNDDLIIEMAQKNMVNCYMIRGMLVQRNACVNRWQGKCHTQQIWKHTRTLSDEIVHLTAFKISYARSNAVNSWTNHKIYMVDNDLNIWPMHLSHLSFTVTIKQGYLIDDLDFIGVKFSGPLYLKFIGLWKQKSNYQR